MNPNDYIRYRDIFYSDENNIVNNAMQEYMSSFYQNVNARLLNQKEIRRNLKEMKKQEKPFVLEFLRTGVPDSRVVSAYESLNNRVLTVRGDCMKPNVRSSRKTNVLFRIKNGKIVANQDRVNQIRKELERFAVLQGFQIEFTDSILSGEDYSEKKKVLLYRWPKHEEVDDSKLLVTMVNTRSIDPVDDEEDDDEWRVRHYGSLY